jgi:hypothetical protein
MTGFAVKTEVATGKAVWMARCRNNARHDLEGLVEGESARNEYADGAHRFLLSDFPVSNQLPESGRASGARLEELPELGSTISCPQSMIAH